MRFRTTGAGQGPSGKGAWEENRTPDLRITSALLYRLSYPGRAGPSPLRSTVMAATLPTSRGAAVTRTRLKSVAVGKSIRPGSPSRRTGRTAIHPHQRTTGVPRLPPNGCPSSHGLALAGGGRSRPGLLQSPDRVVRFTLRLRRAAERLDPRSVRRVDLREPSSVTQRPPVERDPAGNAGSGGCPERDVRQSAIPDSSTIRASISSDSLGLRSSAADASRTASTCRIARRPSAVLPAEWVPSSASTVSSSRSR